MTLEKPIRRKEYNGMNFDDLLSFPETVVEVAISIDDKLVSKDGPLTLQRHLNSYTYEPELLLSTWSYEYPIPAKRGVKASKWWRTELILAKLSDHRKIRLWRDSFLEAARICDAILQGIELR